MHCNSNVTKINVPGLTTSYYTVTIIILFIVFQTFCCFLKKFTKIDIFGSVDGERWKSEVHEEQRHLQQWLLQLHTVSGFCQRGKLWAFSLFYKFSISPVLKFQLYTVFQTKLKHPSYQAMAKTSLQLAVQFLFHTYLRTKKMHL